MDNAEKIEARKRTYELFKAYLDFYAGSAVNVFLDENAAHRNNKFIMRTRDGEPIASGVIEACNKVDPHKKSSLWRMARGNAVYFPTRNDVVTQLEQNIRADEAFMASREDTQKNPDAPVTGNHASVPSVSGDETAQPDMALGLAKSIHKHTIAIKALHTQAAALGLTPEVNKLLAQLNARDR